MTATDLIIIGSGPGGYRAALHAAQQDLRVVIVEKDEVGGTCLNRGCIPTKTLCRHAEIIDTLSQADTFGLEGLAYQLNFSRIVERKDAVVAQLRSGVAQLMQSPGITLVRGEASFRDAHTVVVGDEEYTAKNIIIATGSRSKMPPIQGIDLEGVVTSTGLLALQSVPRRLCIIGAGVIGMEFASVFSSFGSEVSVVEFLKEALPVLDSDIAKRLRQTISRRGVSFHMQSAVRQIEETVAEDGSRLLRVSFDKKGKPATVDADVVLVATGRTANVEGLGLEAIGVETSRQGIVVDDNFETSIPGIYAIGDVNGRCMLAHAATMQGIHAVNYLLGQSDNMRLDIMPSAVFTHPEVASVGKSEDDCKREGLVYTCRKGHYRANGKALVMNEVEGMVKLLLDENQLIIGCHAFGAHAADMVQEVAVLMNQNATAKQLADIVHIHPTLAEILHDLA